MVVIVIHVKINYQSLPKGKTFTAHMNNVCSQSPVLGRPRDYVIIVCTDRVIAVRNRNRHFMDCPYRNRFIYYFLFFELFPTCFVDVSTTIRDYTLVRKHAKRIPNLARKQIALNTRLKTDCNNFLRF